MRRRDVLAGAALVTLARPAAAIAQRSDEAVLVRLVAREEAALKAYEATELGPARDEADHAAALRTQLDALGRRPASRGLDAPAQRVAEASGDAAVEAAIALEEGLVEAYSAALLDLEAPGILQTAATILASHAQHLARLRERAGRDPLA